MAKRLSPLSHITEGLMARLSLGVIDALRLTKQGHSATVPLESCTYSYGIITIYNYNASDKEEKL
jgi:hypothetical protein